MTVTEIKQMRGNRMARTEEQPVRGQAHELVREVVEKGEAENLTAARPMVCRKRPDLVAKSRQENPHLMDEGSARTIADRVREVIDEAAAEASMRPLMEDWGSSHTRQEIISKVRAEMCRTAGGRLLRHLDRTVGSKPYTTASVTAIRQSHNSDEFRKALEILDHGFRIRA
jgi:hypothetical protein